MRTEDRFSAAKPKILFIGRAGLFARPALSLVAAVDRAHRGNGSLRLLRAVLHRQPRISRAVRAAWSATRKNGTSDTRETFKWDNRRAFLHWVMEIAGGRQLIFKLHPNERWDRSIRRFARWSPTRWCSPMGARKR